MRVPPHISPPVLGWKPVTDERDRSKLVEGDPGSLRDVAQTVARAIGARAVDDGRLGQQQIGDGEVDLGQADIEGPGPLPKTDELVDPLVMRFGDHGAPPSGGRWWLRLPPDRGPIGFRPAVGPTADGSRPASGVLGGLHRRYTDEPKGRWR